MKVQAQPPTTFDWVIYSSATFAGLSVLIPIPLLDLAFESYFRRRIVTDIARRRGRRLSPEAVSVAIRGSESCLESCVTLPIWLVFEFVKRLSKKLLYFLTIKEASDRVGYYWHQAFLTDHSLQQGHLDDPVSAALSKKAMQRVLKTASTSPLRQLAYQVVSGTHNVFGLLRRARRGESSEQMEETRAELNRNWTRFAVYLRDLAARYDAAYRQAELEAAAQNVEA